MSIQTINPATGTVLHQYQEENELQIEKKLEKAHQAFLRWKETSFSHRSALMANLGGLLNEKKEELATLITNEMGKPITQAQAEIEKCVWLCEYYAKHAAAALQPRIVETSFKKSMVCYQPLGVIFAIMPWNFPFWQVLRCAVPALMAGNAVILKHAPTTTGCAFAIEALFKEADFETDLFQQVVVDNELAEKIITDDNIVGLSFTGSEKIGRLLAGKAASHLKRTLLELGGTDPYVVLSDADIDLAAECIVTSRLNNCGQVCIAAKRVIAVDSVYDELCDKIQARMSHYQMGAPLEPKTTLGPMAREDLRQKLHQQVCKSIEEGAKLITGGQIPERPGYYYPPTLLTGVKPGMLAFEDELFGPVVVLIKADNEQQAINLANQSRYGLAAAVFTRDLVRGEAIATYQLDAGTCVVNAFVASDPRLPFGGIKNSGYGRELSREGLLEFVNVKTVAIR